MSIDADIEATWHSEFMAERRPKYSNLAGYVRALGCMELFRGVAGLVDPWTGANRLNVFLCLLLTVCWSIFFVSNLPRALRILKFSDFNSALPMICILNLGLTMIYVLVLPVGVYPGYDISYITCISLALIAAYYRVSLNDVAAMYGLHELALRLPLLLIKGGLSKGHILTEWIIVGLCLVGYMKQEQEMAKNYLSRHTIQRNTQLFSSMMTTTKDAILFVNLDQQRLLFQNAQARTWMRECESLEQTMQFFEEFSSNKRSLARNIKDIAAYGNTGHSADLLDKLYSRNANGPNSKRWYLVSLLTLTADLHYRLLAVVLKDVTAFKEFAEYKEVDEYVLELYRKLTRDTQGTLMGLMENLRYLKQQKHDKSASRVAESTISAAQLFANYSALIVDYISKLKGRLNVQPVPSDIHTMFNKVKKTVLPQLNSQTTFCLQLPSHLSEPYITDAARLTSVLTYLLANACKYTPKGKISLVAHSIQNSLIVSIEDTGVGIDDKTIAALMEIFASCDVKTSREGSLASERKGSQEVHTAPTARLSMHHLGLRMVATLTQTLGGHLTVASQRNEGTVFTLHLPINQNENENENEGPIIEDPLEGISPVPSELCADDLKPKMQKQSLPTQKHMVLIVDDNPTNRWVLKAMLETQGLVVNEACNGEEAVGFVEKNYRETELVFMDIEMPIMDGIEASSLITAKHKHIPIIAVTAYTAELDSTKCSASGMREFLQKPVHKKQILELLEKYVT